jgi:hypothetical protein
MKELAKRLARLEALTTEPTPIDPIAHVGGFFQMAVVGLLRGGLLPHESLAEGHARALGLEYKVYRIVALADPADWSRWHREVWQSVLDEHGITPASTPDETLAFMVQMLNWLPDHALRAIESAARPLVTSPS